MELKPWLKIQDAQIELLNNLAIRFNAIEQTPFRNNYWHRLTSRMLNEALNNIKYYCQGQNRNYYYNNNDAIRAQREHEARFGKAEHNILNLLSCLNPKVGKIISDLYEMKDRNNEAREAIFTNADMVGFGFFPKGITDFKPTNLDETLSATLQREMLRENGADTSIPDNHDDKKLTVKVCTTPTSFHIYTNKRSEVTIRRLWYKAIWHAAKHFNLAREFGEDADVITQCIHAFSYPTDESAAIIIYNIAKIIDKKLKNQEENLIEDFSALKQTAMNSNRLRILNDTLRNAEEYYNRNVREFANLSNQLAQARKAVADYSEASFDSIKVFLTKLKEYPRTKMFARLDKNTLQFTVEEPLLHTEDAAWSRYLSNTNSETNRIIQSFASNYHARYGTTQQILQFVTQRFFKEVLVDKNIKMFTTGSFALRADQTDFNISHISLPDNGNFIPHPHVGTNQITCWGSSSREITNCIMNNDGEQAFLQLNYALQQMSATDTAIVRILSSLIVESRYSKVTVYQRKGKTERETFESIIKEFIAHETNKINAVLNSESEGRDVGTVEQPDAPNGN